MNPVYPQLPVVGVGVVVRKNQSVLVVKRAYEPRKGQWSIPGGKVRLGESVRQAALREVAEECSIEIKLFDIIDVVDLIDTDEASRIKYHFVVVEFLAHYVSGVLKPCSDALEARWISPDTFDALEIPDLTCQIINRTYR